MAGGIFAWGVGLWGVSDRPADRGIGRAIPLCGSGSFRLRALHAIAGADADGLSSPGSGGDPACAGCTGDRASGFLGTQRWSGDCRDDRAVGATAVRAADSGSISFLSEQAELK